MADPRNKVGSLNQETDVLIQLMMKWLGGKEKKKMEKGK